MSMVKMKRDSMVKLDKCVCVCERTFLFIFHQKLTPTPQKGLPGY